MKSKKFLNRSSSVFRFQMLRDVIGVGPAHLRLLRSAGSAGWRDRATAAPGDRAAPPALQRCCCRSRKRVLSQLRSCGQATVQQQRRIKQSGFIAALHFSIAPSKGAPYEALGELWRKERDRDSFQSCESGGRHGGGVHLRRLERGRRRGYEEYVSEAGGGVERPEVAGTEEGGEG